MSEETTNALALQYVASPTTANAAAVCESAYPFLNKAAWGLTSDPSLHEDLRQHGAMRLLEVLPKFEKRPGTTFMAFVQGYVVNDMRSVRRKVYGSKVLPECAFTTDDNEDTPPFLDSFPAPEPVDVVERITRERDADLIHEFGQSLIGWRSEQVFYRRLVAKKPCRQHTLAAEFGTTQQAVSQLERNVRAELAEYVRTCKRLR